MKITVWQNFVEQIKMPSVKANTAFVLNEKARNIIEAYNESSDEEDAGMVTKRQAKQDLIFTKAKTQKDSNQQIIDAYAEKHPEVLIASKKQKDEDEESVQAIQKRIKKLKKKLQGENEDETEGSELTLKEDNENRSKKKKILKEITILKEKLVVKNSQLKRKKNQEFREGKEESETKGKQLVVKTVNTSEQKPEDDDEYSNNIAHNGMPEEDLDDSEGRPSKKLKEDFQAADIPTKQIVGSKKKILVEYAPPYTRKGYTVTVAIPGCAIEQNMTEEQKTLICTTIARACTCFKVNEIIVYNEKGDLLDTSNFLPNIEPPVVSQSKGSKSNDDYISLAIDRHVYLANLLYYLETPPYLREKLIPKLKMLKVASSMPQDTLDSAHHLNAMEMSHPYREGLVLEEGNLVYVGHSKLVKLKKPVPPGLRVTVEIYNTLPGYHEGRIVSSETPKEKKGLYWGYNVRLASCFSEVFTQCPYKEGYDMVMTHAEFGKSVDSKDYDLPSFKHLLIVLGGMHNISGAIQSDVNIAKNYNSRNLFDQIVNMCPNNGLRSMRVEDVLTLGLGSLRKRIDFNLPPAEVQSKDLSKFLSSAKRY